MAEQQIPDAWKGQEVEILYQGRDKVRGRKGMLEDLGERGVVLRLDEDAYFFPWTSVIYIKHPTSSSSFGPTPSMADSPE